MTEKSSSVDRPAADSRSSKDPSFRTLYITGVAGWALGMVALFGASWMVTKPETAPIAMLWMLSHCWIAYLFGLVLMGIRALLSKRSLAKPMVAYVLPVVLLAAIAGICYAIYPDASLKGDLLTYLPMVLVFYCLGCLWMALGAGDEGSFPRAVTPSIIGGLILLGFVAVPAFGSDAFRYRGAFRLTTKETIIQDGSLIFDGTLEIQKPGNYEFSAPRYYWNDNMDEDMSTDIELGEIQWGEAGAPKENTLGTFPLRIIWKKGVLQDSPSQMSPYDEYGMVLEIRRPDQDGRLIHSISPNPTVVE